MKKLKTALRILGFLLLLYSALRIIFYLRYFRHESISAGQLLTSFLYGIRMDLTIVFFLNLVFWIYYFWIEPILKPKVATVTGLIILLAINIPFLALNCLDLAYYKFNLRRSTVDLFAVFNDSFAGIGSFLADFWYCFLIFVIIFILLFRVANRLLRSLLVRI